jgi:hypothetical protein
VTWLNNVRAERLLGALALAMAITGCGSGTPEPKASAPKPAAAPAPASPTPPKPDTTKPENFGLTPLPTPNNVLAGVKMGRDDPFAPFIPVAAVGARPRLDLPAAFRFSGVIRSGGASQAIVEYGGNAGALSVGERGGRNTDLLPSGWTVAAIDVDRGRLTLRQGKQTVTAEL